MLAECVVILIIHTWRLFCRLGGYCRFAGFLGRLCTVSLCLRRALTFQRALIIHVYYVANIWYVLVHSATFRGYAISAMLDILFSFPLSVFLVNVRSHCIIHYAAMRQCTTIQIQQQQKMKRNLTIPFMCIIKLNTHNILTQTQPVSVRIVSTRNLPCLVQREREGEKRFVLCGSNITMRMVHISFNAPMDGTII